MCSIYTIYKLVDPRDDQTRYVGYSGQTLSSRLAYHLTVPTNIHLVAWLAELQILGMIPRIEPILEVDGSRSEAEIEETKLIKLFSKTHNLLNVRHNHKRPKGKKLEVYIPAALHHELSLERRDKKITLDVVATMRLLAFQTTS